MKKCMFILLLVIISTSYAYNCWLKEADASVSASSYPEPVDKPNRLRNVITDFMPILKKDGEWNLSWCDEFRENEINDDSWTMQTGEKSWGNNELQYYTDRPENCRLKDGKLIISALKENYQGSRFTSARITTKGKVDFLYGKIDIRAKLPSGKGLLPSFWLMPSEDYYSDRKRNGEIDIMEMPGDKPGIIYGVAHYSLEKKNKSFKKFDSGNPEFSKDFHIYSLEWSPKQLKWLIDDKAYYTFDLKRTFNGKYNPFNKSFYLIMNVAVGGDWPGEPSEATVFPAIMEIDYVRYYEK